MNELPAPPFDGTRVTLVHGDLHDRNIVLGPHGVAVLDVDALGTGPPAEDVGNLAAHLILRSLQLTGNPERGRRTAADFVAGYHASGGVADDAALSVARARTLLRLACVYAARPRWCHLSPVLITEAMLVSTST